MVLDRATGTIEHRHFRDVADYIPPGDALIVNETRVFPARLIGRRAGGGIAEVLLLQPLPEPNTWEALVRPGVKLRAGKRVQVAEDFSIDILDVTPDGNRIVRLYTATDVTQTLERHGRIPLPPYMERPAEELDRERYQTVYARQEGAVAAPTAGLHFTAPLLERLHDNRVELVKVLWPSVSGHFGQSEVKTRATPV